VTTGKAKITHKTFNLKHLSEPRDEVN